jgi:small subunit ribosomal protein S20
LANHKSAAKRARQSERIASVNSKRKSTVRTAEKTLLKAIAEKKQDEAMKLLLNYSSRMNKAAQKGAFHSRTAARKISRLSKQVYALAK